MSCIILNVASPMTNIMLLVRIPKYLNAILQVNKKVL